MKPNRRRAVNMPIVDEDQGRSIARISLPSIQTFTWMLSMPRNARAELKLIGRIKREDVAVLRKYLDLLEATFEAEGEGKQDA